MDETPRTLSPDDRALWRDFLSWSKGIAAEVSRDLDRSELSLPEVEVLGRLYDDPGQLEQQDLLEQLRWSPSRLSHQLSRMSQRQLVMRLPAGSGRRMIVAITEHGKAQAQAALADLGPSIHQHFFATLSTAELETIRAIVSRSRHTPHRG